MRVLCSTKDMSRDEWLEERKKGIGGSDAGAIMGFNPWKSAYEVYLNKTGKGISYPQSERMKIGIELEDYVAKKFEEKTGLKVRRRNAILMHDEHDFIIANVDRMIVGEDEGLECKVTNSFAKSDWEDDKIPLHYELQCHHYMLVTGYSAWWIAALIGNEKVVIKRIERDEEVISIMLDDEIKFWKEYVEKRVDPPADGSKAYTDALKERYPDSDSDLSIDLIGADKKLERRSILKNEIKTLEKEVSAIEQDIKNEMKEAEVALSDNFKVTWKTSARKMIDSKLLEKEKPDIYNEYLKESKSRRFTVKEFK